MVVDYVLAMHQCLPMQGGKGKGKGGRKGGYTGQRSADFRSWPDSRFAATLTCPYCRKYLNLKDSKWQEVLDHNKGVREREGGGKGAGGKGKGKGYGGYQDGAGSPAQQQRRPAAQGPPPEAAAADASKKRKFADVNLHAGMSKAAMEQAIVGALQQTSRRELLAHYKVPPRPRPKPSAQPEAQVAQPQGSPAGGQEKGKETTYQFAL